MPAEMTWVQSVVLGDSSVQRWIDNARQRGLEDERSGAEPRPFDEDVSTMDWAQRVLWDDAYVEDAVRAAYEDGRAAARQAADSADSDLGT